MAEVGQAQINKLEEKAIDLLPGQKEEIKKVTAGIKTTASPAQTQAITELKNMADSLAKGQPVKVDQLKEAISLIASSAKPREKLVIDRAGEATKKIIEHTQNLEKGTGDTKEAVEQVLDFVASMVELIGPSYRSYGKKIKELAPMITAFIESSKENHNPKKKFKLIIPKFGDLLKNFSSAELGESLTSMGDVLGEALTVCEKVSQGDPMEIKEMIEKLAKMARKILHKKDDQLVVPPEIYKVVNLSVNISKIVCSEGRTGLSSPAFLIGLGATVIKDFIGPEQHKDIDTICKVISITLTKGIDAYKISKIDSASKDMIFCVTSGAREIIQAVDPQYVKYVDSMLPVVETIDMIAREPDLVHNGLSSLTKMIKSVTPLLVEHLKVDLEMMESIIAIIDLAVEQSKIMESDSGAIKADYPSLIRSAGKVLIIATKEKDLEKHIEETAKAVMIIQSSIQSSSESVDPILVIQAVVDLTTVFVPNLSPQAQQAMRGIRAIGRQFVNLQSSSSTDLDSLIKDLSEITSMITPEKYSPVIEKIKSVSGVILTSYQSIKDGRNQISTIAEAGGKIISVMTTDEKWRKFTSLAVEGSYLIEDVMSSRKGIKPVELVRKAAAIAIKMGIAPKENLDQLLKEVAELHEIMTDKCTMNSKNVKTKVNNFIAAVKNHIDIKNMHTYTNFISEAIIIIESMVQTTTQTQDIDFGSLAEQVCELICKVSDLAKLNVQKHIDSYKVGKIVGLVGNAVKNVASDKLDVNIIIDSVSEIAYEFDRSSADSIQKVGKTITELFTLVESMRDGGYAVPEELIKACKMFLDSISPSTTLITDKITKVAEVMLKEASAYQPIQKLEQAETIAAKVVKYIGSAKNIVGTIEPDFATHIEKVELLISSVQNQAKKLSQNKVQELSKILESSKPLILLLAPKAELILSKTIQILEAAGKFVSGVETNLNNSMIYDFHYLSESLIEIYPQLAIPIFTMEEVLNRLEGFVQSMKNEQSCIKASEFMSVVSSMVSSLAPVYKPSVDAGYEFMIAIERVVDSYNSAAKVDKASDVAYLVLRNISKGRPSYKLLTDRVTKILDFIHEELPKEPTDVHYKGVVDDAMLDAHDNIKPLKFEDVTKCIKSIIEKTVGIITISEEDTNEVNIQINLAIEALNEMFIAIQSNDELMTMTMTKNVAKAIVKNWGYDQVSQVDKVVENLQELVDKLNTYSDSESNIADLTIVASAFFEISDPAFNKRLAKISGLTSNLQIILSQLTLEDSPTQEDMESISNNASKLIEVFDPSLTYQAHMVKQSLDYAASICVDIQPQDDLLQFVGEKSILIEKVLSTFVQPRQLGIGIAATLNAIIKAMELERVATEESDSVYNIAEKVVEFASALEPRFTLGDKLNEIFSHLDTKYSNLSFSTIERIVVSIAKMTNAEFCNPKTIHPFLELCTFSSQLIRGAERGFKFKLSSEDGQYLNLKILAEGEAKVVNK